MAPDQIRVSHEHWKQVQNRSLNGVDAGRAPKFLADEHAQLLLVVNSELERVRKAEDLDASQAGRRPSMACSKLKHKPFRT